MATLAIPQGASKLLATTKGKVYAAAGAAALVFLAVTYLGGGTDTAAPASTPAAPAATTPATTVAPAPTGPTTPYSVSPRNPFTKGDGSLPKAAKG